MVLDRLFLWIFGAAAVVGSFMILTESPSLFQKTEPIDVKFSKIAQQERGVNFAFCECSPSSLPRGPIMADAG